MPKEEKIVIASAHSTSQEAILGMKFPVRVMPITTVDPKARLFITGGGDKGKVIVWDVEGNRVPFKRPGLKKIVQQFRTAFKKLPTTSVTIEFYLTENEDGDYKAVCIDINNTKAHATGQYEGTYEERLPVLEAFLSQCGFGKRNRIYGPCIKTFFDWDELWDDMFGADGLCTGFPYVSIRHSDSQYKVGLDENWCVISGEDLYACQQPLIEILQS